MTRYLLDKSALARAAQEPVRQRLARVLGNDDVRTCPIVDLEILYSARTAAEYEQWRADRRVGYPSVPLSAAVGDRALEVQRALARNGQHRGVSIPDLLIAACAEVDGAVVLHYDADYERISAVTGQAAEWVVPRGTL